MVVVVVVVVELECVERRRKKQVSRKIAAAIDLRNVIMVDVASG